MLAEILTNNGHMQVVFLESNHVTFGLKGVLLE
jgi:hypothetical protein